MWFLLNVDWEGGFNLYAAILWVYRGLIFISVWVQSCKTTYIVAIYMLVVNSGHNFTHQGTTAQFWRMQNYDLIRWLMFIRRTTNDFNNIWIISSGNASAMGPSMPLPWLNVTAQYPTSDGESSGMPVIGALKDYLDSKVHGDHMGRIWGRQDPGGPHVGPMKFAIWVMF